MKSNSVLMKHLATKDSAEDKLDVIFLTLLSQTPTLGEKNLMLQKSTATMKTVTIRYGSSS